MAPTSAAVLIPAVAMVLMAMQLSAAAAAAPRPAPIGLPGCDTTCGNNVSVPYPFGLGPSHCYWPGLNLTCDTSQHPPQLLLGDGSLRVAEISLWNLTVRVMGAGYIIDTTGDLFTSDGWNASLDFGRGFREHGYLLSVQNELVVIGCNVMATLSADIVGEETTKIVSGCASFCTKSDHEDGFITDGGSSCSGTLSCCRAPFTSSGVPKGVEARWLYSGNHTREQTLAPVTVFVAEQGWVDKQQQADGFEEAPFLLDFGVKQGLPQLQPNGSNYECTQDVQRMVCKSEHSYCSASVRGYTCNCDPGFDGNPYLAGGCQDVDECKARMCFGVCTNRIGSYDCQCPQGTYGDPDVEGGCVDYNFIKDALSPTVAPVPTGMPGCNTTCGDVSVPYPFGFGPSRCYWPGFNTTCDTSHNPPRLLLHGNGNVTLQVVHISLRNFTVHVIHHQSGSNELASTTIYYADGPTSLVTNVHLPDIGDPYVLSTRNEFIVFSGWDVRATLYGEYRNGSSSSNADSIHYRTKAHITLGK